MCETGERERLIANVGREVGKEIAGLETVLDGGRGVLLRKSELVTALERLFRYKGDELEIFRKVSVTGRRLVRALVDEMTVSSLRVMGIQEAHSTANLPL